MDTSTYLLLAGDGGPANAAIVAPLTSGGRIFLAGGRAWRYKGVSAFPLCRLYSEGWDIDPFLHAFHGFNVLRVWDYVTWPDTGWTSCTPDQWLAFLRYVGARGWYVEATIYTGDEPDRVRPGLALAEALTSARPANLLLEGANEPDINGKRIDEGALRQIHVWAAEAAIPFASGHYAISKHFHGSYLTAHTPRDAEWPRKAHDLLEYYDGGGPATKQDPAHHVPIVADEPIRPDQAAFNVQDFRAYFGACALLGAGATFHFDGGKYGLLPTPDEDRCKVAALEGLDAFPPDAPRGWYRRIDEEEGRGDEGSLRTFVVGDCMVCVRPDHPSAPEPGWTSRDPDGILWTR